MSDFYTTKELVCDETEPRTYITPVFEFVGDNKLRIHHIDLYSFGNTVKLVPLRHLSKQKQRIFELEEENARLRELAKKALKCIETPLTCEECYSTFKGCHIRGAMRELGIEV